MTISAKRLHKRLRKVLVGEQAHLRWNWECLVYVGEIAGVRQTGKDVLALQARIIGQDFLLGLAGCEKFQNELDGQTRPADHWLAPQDFGIRDNPLGELHVDSLSRQMMRR